MADHGRRTGRRGAAFSPDDRLLALAGADGTIGPQDLSDPTRPSTIGELTGHMSVAYWVGFTPDGRTLASQAERRICATTANNLNQARWQPYIPELPFSPPCS